MLLDEVQIHQLEGAILRGRGDM